MRSSSKKRKSAKVAERRNLRCARADEWSPSLDCPVLQAAEEIALVLRGHFETTDEW